MVKEYFLTEFKPNEAFLGTFLDETAYDVLIDEDADVYKPSTIENDRSDDNVLLKFRKRVFSEEVQKNAYEGLRDGATTSHNRGISAGAIEGSLQKQSPDSENGREWVTDFQHEVMNYFIQPSVLSLFGEEDKVTLEKIKEKYKGQEDKVTSLRGHVWLSDKVKKENFNFVEWANETEKLDKAQKVEEARIIAEEYVSGTNYANPVFSGVGGFYDRYPRIPFCRATSYTANNKEKFEKSIDFIEGISDWFKELIPTRWEAQKNAIDMISEDYHIGKSVYSTITINKNFRTACHRDAGDLTEGFGNLAALAPPGSKGWKGGYLCFPEYRVAVNVRPGDVLLMDVHSIHGNTPISAIEGESVPERISIVCYFRENMLNCGDSLYEKTRENFVKFNRSNKNHRYWRENWNGVFPSMWSDESWYDYLRATLGEDVLRQYHPEAFTADLEDFFS